MTAENFKEPVKPPWPFPQSQRGVRLLTVVLTTFAVGKYVWDLEDVNRFGRTHVLTGPKRYVRQLWANAFPIEEDSVEENRAGWKVQVTTGKQTDGQEAR